jgi:ribosomal protein S18 acetylase RimI-like enzyme
MDITIRRAEVSDANTIAMIMLTARLAAMPWLPVVHTDAELRWWVRTSMLVSTTVWVAEEAGQPVGFAALRGEVLDHLYIHPYEWSRGIGTQLLDTVRSEPLDMLALYVFQRNARARRFYEARGFKLMALGTGATNEEREPDAYYEWRRSGSVGTVS